VLSVDSGFLFSSFFVLQFFTWHERVMTQILGLTYTTLI
jgi:hypothetical protein